MTIKGKLGHDSSRRSNDVVDTSSKIPIVDVIDMSDDDKGE